MVGFSFVRQSSSTDQKIDPHNPGGGSGVSSGGGGLNPPPSPSTPFTQPPFPGVSGSPGGEPEGWGPKGWVRQSSLTDQKKISMIQEGPLRFHHGGVQTPPLTTPLLPVNPLYHLPFWGSWGFWKGVGPKISRFFFPPQISFFFSLSGIFSWNCGLGSVIV